MTLCKTLKEISMNKDHQKRKFTLCNRLHFVERRRFFTYRIKSPSLLESVAAQCMLVHPCRSGRSGSAPSRSNRRASEMEPRVAARRSKVSGSPRCVAVLPLLSLSRLLLLGLLFLEESLEEDIVLRLLRVLLVVVVLVREREAVVGRVLVVRVAGRDGGLSSS